MPSTYTLNNGIELIATGEQSGTWGDTTNTNLSLVDTALDGQVTVTLPSAGTSGSPNTLAISDGAASDGRNRMVIFNDGGDLGATAYVQLTPNDAEKIIYVRNDLAGSRSIILFQGTYNASNDYELPAGTTAVIYFDGAGSGAVAANVFNNAYFDSLRLGSVSVTEIIDDDTMATAAATNIATSESIKAYVDAKVTAEDLDFAGDSGTGAVDLDSQTFTIAGTSNEIETSASGQTLTIGLPDDVTITGDLTVDTDTLYVDSTNNRVGVGTSSPTRQLSVVSSDTASLLLQGADSTGYSQVLFGDVSSETTGFIQYYHGDNAMRLATGGGTNAMILDSSQRVLIGGQTSARSNYSSTTGSGVKISLEGTTADNTKIATVRNVAGVNGPYIVLGKTRGSTVNSATVVVDDDHLGALSYQGADGTDLREAASIRGEVDGTPGASDMPGRIVFSTTPDGTTTPVERMRITKAGYVGIGVNNPEDFTGGGNNLVVGTGSGDQGISIYADLSSDSTVFFVDSSSGTGAYRGQVRYRHDVDDMSFHTAGGFEAMRIDSSQRVLIGHTSSIPNGGDNQKLQVTGTGSSDGISLARFNATFGAYFTIGRSGSDTVGTYTAVPINDEIGRIQWAVADGTDMASVGAMINAVTEQQAASNDVPTRLTFSTTADGASSPTERMRITNAGYVGINNTNPGSTLDIINHQGDHPIAVQIWGADNTSEYLGLGQNGGDSVITAGSSAGQNTDLVLRTADGGVETNRVRISGATGNVQIDTDQSIDTATNMPLQIARNGGSLIKQSADYSGSVNGLYWLLTAAGTNRYTGGIYGNTSVSGGEAQNAHIRIWNEQLTPTASDSPGYITFSTTADGTASATERMRIHSNGVISMGQGFTPIGALGILQANTNDDNGNSGLQVRTDTSGTRYGGFGVYDDVGGKEGLAITAGSSSSASSDMFFRTAASGAETERMRITRDGIVLINSDAYVSVTGGAAPLLQLQGSGFASSTISTTAFRSDTSSGPTVSLLRTRSGTVGSGRAIVQDGDELGKIRFYGADGVDFDNFGANIAAKVNGTPGADDMPGSLVFGTTADGGISSTDRMQINSAGRVSMSGNAGDMTVKGNAALTLSDLKAGSLGGNISFHYAGNTGYATIGTTSTNDLILEADPSSVGASSAIRFNIDGNEVGRFQSDKIFRADTELWVTDGGYDSDHGLRIRPKIGNNLYGFSDAGTTYNIGLINEEGTANQAIIIGDVTATNNTLFGVSVGTGANPTTGSEGTWNAKLSLKGNGSLNLPNQPAARVRWSIAAGNELQDVIGGSGPSGTLFRYGWDILPTDAAVTFSEQWDNGGNVDTNGRFTAPSSGTYAAQFFFYHNAPDGTAEEFKVTISINGAQTEFLVVELEQNPAYTIPRIQGWSGAFGLNAGDTLAPGFVPTAGGLNFEVPIALFSVYKVT